MIQAACAFIRHFEALNMHRLAVHVELTVFSVFAHAIGAICRTVTHILASANYFNSAISYVSFS